MNQPAIQLTETCSSIFDGPNRARAVLEGNPNDSRAWAVLGDWGVVPLNGVTVTRQECYVRALELDPENSVVWTNLGSGILEDEGSLLGAPPTVG